MSSALPEKDKKMLLEIARKSIAETLSKEPAAGSEGNMPEVSAVLQEKRGVFVTLHKSGQLRGCIGNLSPVSPLLKSVRRNAQQAAFHDTRFRPLKAAELDQISIEISILTPMHKVEYRTAEDLIRKVRPGIDGVMIEKRNHSATFLPQVWEQLRQPELFFEQLCLKAGLMPDAWRSGTLDVFTYQVQSFEEPAQP